MEEGDDRDRPTKEKMIEGGRLERGKESNTAIEEERKWREGRRERGKQKKRDNDINGREGVMEKAEKGGEKKRREINRERERETFQWKIFLLGTLLALQR